MPLPQIFIITVTDAPDSKRVLVPGAEKGLRIQEYSRTASSLMICGAADGELVPPMVVYKFQNLNKNLTKGGHIGTQ